MKNLFHVLSECEKKNIFPDFLYTDGIKIMNENLGFAMV